LGAGAVSNLIYAHSLLTGSYLPNDLINASWLVMFGLVASAAFELLEISDNGIGFDMQYHEHIFKIFQRLHRDDQYPGTGIGLALVRKALERVGGRVWARSEVGRGATFCIELPQSMVASDPVHS
jgi:light-regulated signal transduction histidine kinase (bacteriophytochrome)